MIVTTFLSEQFLKTIDLGLKSLMSDFLIKREEIPDSIYLIDQFLLKTNFDLQKRAVEIQSLNCPSITLTIRDIFLLIREKYLQFYSKKDRSIIPFSETNFSQFIQGFDIV